MSNDSWKTSLQEFFAQRGQAVSGGRLGLEELAYVSGRDPRVWTLPIYDDLINDIVSGLAVATDSTILEVGCASGFLARGLATRVARYEGLDLAEPALATARQLGLANATFSLGDGAALPYNANSFDAALCYDVFTNFPEFSIGADLIAEMLRVTRPGGQVLIGSIPDGSCKDAYSLRVVEVAAELQAKHGPLSQRYIGFGETVSADRRPWLQRMFTKLPLRPVAAIECFYFEKHDFYVASKALGVPCEIVDVHTLNPYRGFRFNAIYKKPGE